MAIHCYFQTFSALIITFSMINVNLIQSASTPDACLNYCSGGYCYEIDAGPKCVCSPKWTGERCDIPQNETFVDQVNGTKQRNHPCSALPADYCKNSGICHLDTATKKFGCHCNYPYAGNYCESIKFNGMYCSFFNLTHFYSIILPRQLVSFLTLN